jgi:hypothetical protein
MGLKPKCDLPYDAVIFFNDGVRGPFLPSYMPKDYHWSQAFLDKLTALHHSNITEDAPLRNVALVGTSIACLSKDDEAVMLDPSFFGPKVEGFAFAITGDALAYVRNAGVTFFTHADKFSAIVSGEYDLSRTVLTAPAKWRVTSLLKEHEGIDFRDQRNWNCNKNIHPSRTASYGPGEAITPLEVIFHKARWHSGDRVSENIMAFYTDWQDEFGGSYEPSIKKSLGDQKANKASPMAKSGASTLVSYVYGGGIVDARVEAPLSLRSGAKTDICDDNLDVFLKRGYSPNVDVDFVFTLLPSRNQAPKRLQDLARVFTNVFVDQATWDCGVDLCQHQSVVDKKRRMKNYSEFIFLNCGARGPYGLAQGLGQQTKWYRRVRIQLCSLIPFYSVSGSAHLGREGERERESIFKIFLHARCRSGENQLYNISSRP